MLLLSNNYCLLITTLQPGVSSALSRHGPPFQIGRTLSFENPSAHELVIKPLRDNCFTMES